MSETSIKKDNNMNHIENSNGDIFDANDIFAHQEIKLVDLHHDFGRNYKTDFSGIFKQKNIDSCKKFLSPFYDELTTMDIMNSAKLVGVEPVEPALWIKHLSTNAHGTYKTPSKYKLSEDFIRNNQDEIDWCRIVETQVLSEDIIMEFHKKMIWHQLSRQQVLSEDLIRTFLHEVDWAGISYSQKLSESFIGQHEHEIKWGYIAANQTLSEQFIKKYGINSRNFNWATKEIKSTGLLNFRDILKNQRLSEAFIREIISDIKDSISSKESADAALEEIFQLIAMCQPLSEEFIEEFAKDIDWFYISKFQVLSRDFIKKHCSDVIWEMISIYQPSIDSRALSDSMVATFKCESAKAYAKKHQLECDDKYLYAYRNHDRWGRGIFNRAIFYSSGKYYRDWHCDVNPYNSNSYGLGILPKGNTLVRVKIEDWGCEVNSDSKSDGKARVWGFEVL